MYFGARYLTCHENYKQNLQTMCLPPTSAVEVIEYVLSLFLCEWVCDSYVVHRLNSTGLRCAPPTCVLHHGAQGGPMSVRSRGHHRHFLVVNMEHAHGPSASNELFGVW